MNTQEKELRINVLRESTNMTIEECQAHVEKVAALCEKMQGGVVKFTFKKKDGTIRHAVGTLLSSLINYDFKGAKPAPPTIVPYWDMEKESFRSFSLASYIGMED